MSNSYFDIRQHSGKTDGSIPKTTFPVVKIASVIMKAPIIFSRIPTLAISYIFILPVPKIMAFGGVATGSMNAHDADSVAGIMRKRGFILIATARPARIGGIISVVAVLDVSSVRKVTARHRMMINITG